jgi:hypothetical protein
MSEGPPEYQHPEEDDSWPETEPECPEYWLLSY